VKRYKDITWDTNNPINVHGFCSWWEADLAEGITLSSHPRYQDKDEQQVYLPMDNVMRCEEGDTLSLQLVSRILEDDNDIDISWTVRQRRKGKVVNSSSNTDIRKIYNTSVEE